MSGLFADRLEEWRGYTTSPWGRLRYLVVADLLARHTTELGGALRVLDVGGGDGMDSLPLALAGHEVTVVDPTVEWLAEARLDDLPAGEWDPVLW